MFFILIFQIAVIGSQSAGKSSVLEKIVGKNFLPTGTGCVTKRPLHLNLEQSDRNSAEISYYDCNKQTNIHRNKLNLNQLTDEIKQANSFQHENEFIPQPITVTIKGPQNPNLTLIDFPGVVADPDKRQTIIDMIKPIIELDTSIILAVAR